MTRRTVKENELQTALGELYKVGALIVAVVPDSLARNDAHDLAVKTYRIYYVSSDQRR